jgi:hypothetical protein
MKSFAWYFHGCLVLDTLNEQKIAGLHLSKGRNMSASSTLVKLDGDYATFVSISKDMVHDKRQDRWIDKSKVNAVPNAAGRIVSADEEKAIDVMNALDKPKVLNVDLYEALVAVFGEVRIANEGLPLRSKLARDPYDPSKWTEKIVEAGEEYRICCPFCPDTRFRLYINHRWNTRSDADNKDRHSWRSLVNCFNEKCDTSPLEGMLKGYVRNRPFVRRTIAQAVSDAPLVRVTWPGVCHRLPDLPHSHPAIQYLIHRKFDPLEIDDLWNVRYCSECEYSPRYASSLVAGRLVIPIYWQGEMVGWQTRAIVEGSIPKYYTMPGLRKQQILYNGDRAKTYQVGVLVEGVTDAWRVGPRACALLGKSISVYQQQYLCGWFAGGWLVNLLDPDAMDNMEAIHKHFDPKTFPGTYVVLRLPDGTDAGSTDRDELYALLNAKLKGPAR